MGKRPRKSSEVTTGSGRAAVRWARSHRYLLWAVVAALLVVGGVAGSAVAAGSLARSDSQKSRQAFEASSGEVASTLQLAIHDEESLVVNASAFVLDNPDASNAQLARWLSSVQAFERYPELIALGKMVLVPASEMPAFAARMVIDPPGPLAEDGTFQLIPPGDRQSYCLVAIGTERDGAPALPAGFDFCADPASGQPILTARDSGHGSYEPIPIGGTAVIALGVQVPIYRGATPATVAARREAFVGWFGMVLEPQLVFDRALQAHQGMGATLRYHDENSDAVFSSGVIEGDAHSFLVDLQNGWTVETFGAVASGSVWGNGNALALLSAGVVLSLLLGALVLVLASGQARALRLVAERTRELRGAQAQLVDSARQAGMAEIATNVLHNVGNVLNSVNVSANLVCQKVRGSKSAGLTKAVALMDAHADDLGEFLAADPRGKALPGYLAKLATTLAAERDSIDQELLRLTEGVAHIKEIVSAQQSLAGVSSVIEPVRIDDLVDDALRMAGVFGDHEVTVFREFPDAEGMLLDRHRIVLILVNLISNATCAMQDNVDRPRHLRVRVEVSPGRTVRVSVADNGEGVPSENLTRIFVHGFTTHVDGHGFGLHSSALAAKEMGGTLTVHSDGAGTGAMFTLEVPLATQRLAA